jgi:hypothetical protein
VASANAGPAQALTVGTLALSDSNYAIASSGNTGTITQALITLNGTRAYDATTAFNGSVFGTISTGINGETLTVNGAGSVASADAGPAQALTVGTLALSDSNYAIASSGNTGTITQALITLNGTRAYDATTAFDGSVFGTISTGINGETVTVNGAGSVASANAGPAQALTVGTLALSDSNYAIASSGNTGTIIVRSITVTADNSGKVQGATDPLPFTYQITSGSLVNGDSFSGLLTRDAGEALGTYAITQGTLGLSANYALAFNNGVFTITAPAPTGPNGPFEPPGNGGPPSGPFDGGTPPDGGAPPTTAGTAPLTTGSIGGECSPEFWKKKVIEDESKLTEEELRKRQRMCVNEPYPTDQELPPFMKFVSN